MHNIGRKGFTAGQVTHAESPGVHDLALLDQCA
jgi:hypothetical protein